MKRIEGVPPDSGGVSVSFELDGETLQGLEGEPLACSMWAAGERIFSRSIKYHRPRGPYCFAAACTQCLMRVDGVPNVYTCQVPLRAGMRVERQNAYPSVKHDLFVSIDWFFPRGLDHHEMFAGVPVAQDVMAKVARKLAGLGKLPDTPAPLRPPAEIIRAQAVIVGGGVAGCAAAAELIRRGIDFVLLERDMKREGLAIGPASFQPGQLRLRTQAIGLYESHWEGNGGKFIAAVCEVPHEPRAILVQAERFLLAPGGHPALLPFENNDLPGVMASRAVARLIRDHAFVPGERATLVGYGDERLRMEALLRESGVDIAASLEVGEVEGFSAIGRGKVSGARFLPRGSSAPRKVACDLIVVCLPPSPSFELARQGGAEVVFRPEQGHFVVASDAEGRTKAPDLFVAGEVTGVMSSEATREMGARTARALAESLGGRT